MTSPLSIPDYFGWKRHAFADPPEEAFIPASRLTVKNALTKALARQEGLILLTGEAGAGKSFYVNQRLAELLKEDGRKVIPLSHPDLPAAQFLQQLIRGLADDPDGMTDRLDNGAARERLFKELEARAAEGRKIFIAVDEAHHMSEENLATLNQILQFTNGDGPIAQILLAGRPDINRKLQAYPFPELTERIVGSAHLFPFTDAEIREYIELRLARAALDGGGRIPAIAETAWRLIARAAEGNLSLTNRIMRQALALAAEREEKDLSFSLLQETLAITNPDLEVKAAPKRTMGMAALAAALVLLAAAGAWKMTRDDAAVAPLPPPPVVERSTAPATPTAPPAPVQEKVTPTTDLPAAETPPKSAEKPPPTDAVEQPAELKNGAQMALAPAFPPSRPAPVVKSPDATPPAAPKIQETPRPEPSEGVKTAPEEAPYALQAASFGNRDNAERFKKRLQEKGFPAYIRSSKDAQGKSLFQIRLAFKEKEAARAEAKRLKRAGFSSYLIKQK